MHLVRSGKKDEVVGLSFKETISEKFINEIFERKMQPLHLDELYLGQSEKSRSAMVTWDIDPYN